MDRSERSGSEQMKEFGEFDYIVVGAGTAGCLLANRLSADPTVRVLLLEAGGRDNYVWIHVPIGYLYTMNNPRTDWCFSTEPEPGLNGRALAYPRGKVLGGCSSINGMIYMRGQADDYDHWRQLGNRGWGWDDVLPVFRQTEDFARGADELHGAGGEWRVEDPRIGWEVLDAWREAAAEVGIPKTDDFNRGSNEGCGYFQVNQRTGVRWNASKAFIKPIANRPNLQVQTHAQVERLLIEDKRGAGVCFRLGNELHGAKCRGEVILSSGAIGSPQLLKLSGVGPGDELRTHGVDVVHDLAGVGENLQDHLQLRCIYKVSNVRTLNEWSGSLFNRAKMGLEYLLRRRGPLTMAPSQLGAFVRSNPSVATPNLQYHVQPLSLDKFGEPLHSFPAITASVCNLRPQSRGQVALRSADPREAPRIQPNYLQASADQQVAVEAIRMTRRICGARAFAKYSPEEFLPGPMVESEDALTAAAGDIGTTIFHPVGTAKMGADDRAVVDDRLRVHGMAGLRVVDASVMPTITSGNTNSPTLMIAEKGAAMILEDRRASN
ncbi:MAG: GMC family oxidoreductase N-terminal domain-containing protein [Pseudomonadota bacterium]